MDDVLITGESKEVIIQVKQFLHNQFCIKNLGYIKYFLGVEIARSTKGLFLNQQKYILDILEDTRFTNVKAIYFSFPIRLKLILEEDKLLQEFNQ